MSATMENQLRQVQNTLNGISSKFVGQPTINQVRSDLLVALKRFRYCVRWKAFWRNAAEPDDNLLFDGENVYSKDGLTTDFKPCSKYAQKPPILYPNVENFLREIERELLSNLYEKQRYISKGEVESQLEEALETLSENAEWCMVRTDKTNRFTLVQTAEYMQRMKDNLQEKCKKVDRQEISDLYDFALHLIEDAKHVLKKREYDFLKESIENKEVPEPILLWKDHKLQTPTPVRFVLPCGNFTANLAKIGYTAIKNMFESNQIGYEKFTIRNSFDFIKKIKSLGLRRKKTIYPRRGRGPDVSEHKPPNGQNGCVALWSRPDHPGRA